MLLFLYNCLRVFTSLQKKLIANKDTERLRHWNYRKNKDSSKDTKYQKKEGDSTALW